MNLAELIKETERDTRLRAINNIIKSKGRYDRTKRILSRAELIREIQGEPEEFKGGSIRSLFE